MGLTAALTGVAVELMSRTHLATFMDWARTDLAQKEQRKKKMAKVYTALSQ